MLVTGGVFRVPVSTIGSAKVFTKPPLFASFAPAGDSGGPVLVHAATTREQAPPVSDGLRLECESLGQSIRPSCPRLCPPGAPSQRPPCTKRAWSALGGQERQVVPAPRHSACAVRQERLQYALLRACDGTTGNCLLRPWLYG